MLTVPRGKHTKGQGLNYEMPSLSTIIHNFLKKGEPGKEVQAEELATEKKEKTEVFYMEIKIS